MPNLAGLHDREAVAVSASDTWLLDTIALSENPIPINHGKDWHWITRANWGYSSAGTLPTPDRYGEYVARLVTYVAGSKGCSRWQIGNEISLSREWPDNKPIYPANYADCYLRARSAIHAIPGHKHDEVLIAASGPWNNELKYAGNANGDWIQNFMDTINACNGKIDGFSIHSYTHNYDSALVNSEAMMDAPFQNRHFEFRTYRDYLNAVPAPLHSLPVYLTEANGNGPWRAVGLMPAMLEEINRWNQIGSPKIQCCIFYRYPRYDEYHIEGKDDVIAEYHAAVAKGYQSPETNKIHLPQIEKNIMPNIIDPRMAQAILKVESGGRSHGSDGKPLIRFEAHIFKSYLKNDNLWAEHFQTDPQRGWIDQMWHRSSADTWKPIHTGNQKDEWEVFSFARGINPDAAHNSISVGSAQIMGFNHKRVGFPSAEAMLTAFQSSEMQVIGFINYFLSDPTLMEAVDQKDFREIARKYNGSGQVDFYAGLLEKAYNETV